MTTVLTNTRRPPRAAVQRAAEWRSISDCAEWAWWISTKTCLDRVNPDVWNRYPPGRIHHAAVCLMAAELVLEWALRGYTVHLVPAAGFAPPPDTDSMYMSVANAAAAAVDPVVLAASLDQPGHHP